MLSPVAQDTEKFDEICSWCPLPPKLIGDKVFLTVFDDRFADDFLVFMTDETTAMGLGSPLCKAYTRIEEKDVLSSAKCNFHDNYQFMIWDLSDRKVIGSCSIMDCDPIHRTAEVGINIGARAYRGGGRGTDAMRLLLCFGFEYLDLENICLGVCEFNDSAIRCYEKCGFVVTGRRRKAKFVAGKRWDSIQMDILKSEYFEKKKFSE